MRISKIELILKLKKLQESRDYEDAHYQADKLLLRYIDDKAVIKEYGKIGKWYA